MLKTLIVEDDYRIALMHEKYVKKVQGMESAGYALNAAEMWEKLKIEKIDLLILDIYLPDQLGTDILKELRNDYPLIDVIIITAATDKGYLESAVRRGIVDFLIKPVSLNIFISTLEDYIDKQKKLKQLQTLDQSAIDHHLGKKSETARELIADLPTGIDYLTLEKVREAIKKREKGFNSENMAAELGVSRTTARRYLEYLITTKEIEAKLEYGVIGRPERYYHKLN